MAEHTKGPLVMAKRAMGVIKGGPFRQYTNGSAQSQLFLAMTGEDMPYEERDANAEHLVKCWNSYYALVEAAQMALSIFRLKHWEGDPVAVRLKEALALAGEVSE